MVNTGTPGRRESPGGQILLASAPWYSTACAKELQREPLPASTNDQRDAEVTIVAEATVPVLESVLQKLPH